MKALLAAFNRLESLIRSLYLPDPARGVEERALKPFEWTLQEPLQAYRDANAANDIRGRRVWTSPALQTSGYTHHNCFPQIQVISDSVPAGTGMRDLFTAVLEGACGSAWVEMDTATLQSNGQLGPFEFSLLARDSLALSTRLALYLADNANYGEQPPEDPRELQFTLDGVLVSGVTY